jgi:hypothetical protein
MMRGEISGWRGLERGGIMVVNRVLVLLKLVVGSGGRKVGWRVHVGRRD